MKSTSFAARVVILACLCVTPCAYSFDEYVDEEVEYFKSTNPAIDTVTGKREATLENGYRLSAAYGYPKGSSFKGHFVGVFLLRNASLIEVFDMIPSERGLDFLPIIEESSKSHVVISFISDYGELARRKYEFDLSKARKLIRIVRLPAEGIPDDLP